MKVKKLGKTSTGGIFEIPDDLAAHLFENYTPGLHTGDYRITLPIEEAYANAKLLTRYRSAHIALLAEPDKQERR